MKTSYELEPGVREKMFSVPVEKGTVAAVCKGDAESQILRELTNKSPMIPV